MTENTTATATREIPASAADIFDLLSNPQRHSETDASGSVRSADFGERLQKVGDSFRMNMVKGDGSEYQTENTVFAIQQNKVIGWKNEKNLTSDVVVGAKWLYELEPVDAGNTRVSLTYDYSDIENPTVVKMAKENFAKEDGLEKSLNALADALA